ncbi:hypothetical protein QVD17_23516 [Tagetes erecta]|uniref:Uncharacterized protein n=1 Tax=Tagetes erecta TaxID=13708 RepID=A0AAD8KEN7_TARER|nr:hypothetical protein QVD17_23516 [Tagetes erecta]
METRHAKFPHRFTRELLRSFPYHDGESCVNEQATGISVVNKSFMRREQELHKLLHDESYSYERLCYRAKMSTKEQDVSSPARSLEFVSYDGGSETVVRTSGNLGPVVVGTVEGKARLRSDDVSSRELRMETRHAKFPHRFTRELLRSFPYHDGGSCVVVRTSGNLGPVVVGTVEGKARLRSDDVSSRELRMETRHAKFPHRFTRELLRSFPYHDGGSCVELHEQYHHEYSYERMCYRTKMFVEHVVRTSGNLGPVVVGTVEGKARLRSDDVSSRELRMETRHAKFPHRFTRELLRSFPYHDGGSCVVVRTSGNLGPVVVGTVEGKARLRSDDVSSRELRMETRHAKFPHRFTRELLRSFPYHDGGSCVELHEQYHHEYSYERMCYRTKMFVEHVVRTSGNLGPVVVGTVEGKARLRSDDVSSRELRMETRHAKFPHRFTRELLRSFPYHDGGSCVNEQATGISVVNKSFMRREQELHK